MPKPDTSLLPLQKEQLRESIAASKALRNQPVPKIPEAPKMSPPSQQTAADQAAAERQARINMAGKKGYAWTQNPNLLGGASGL